MTLTTFEPGSDGRVVSIKVNCFAITKLPTKQFYQYHFEIIPDTSDRAERRLEIFMALQEQHALKFMPRAVFDGKFNVYSSLKDLEGQYSVQMGRANPQNPNARPPTLYVITLKTAKMINPLRLNESFKNKQEQVSDVLAMLQIFIRQAVATRFFYPPKSKTVYTTKAPESIGFGLELWNGIFQSVRPGMDRLFINVDSSFGIMYASGSLVNNVMEMLRLRDRRDLARLDVGHPQWNQLKAFLKKVKVSVSMFPKKKPRPIFDIVPRGGSHTFMWNDRETTVAEYFRRTHSETVADPAIFGVVLSSTRRDVVPAQFCSVVEGQLYKKRVSPEVTASVVRASDKPPKERLRLIAAAVSGQNTILDYANSDFMNRAGLSVDANPIGIQGRYLEPPRIKFHDQTIGPNNGSWNVVNHKLFKPGYILCWSVVNFERNLERDPQRLQNFITILVQCLTSLGIQQLNGKMVGPPRWPTLHKALGQNPIPGLQAALDGMEVEKTWKLYEEAAAERNQFLSLPPSPLIIVILPLSAADIRKDVKQWSDVTTGVPTQCVRENKLRNVNNQYCNNLALKINARIEGTNSAASNIWMQRLSGKPTMVVAADVSHPGPGIMHRPSMTGLVASVDLEFSRYAAFSRLQNPRTEIIERLNEMFNEALVAFGSANMRKVKGGASQPIMPQRIIFYRDGVSEGEYQKVVDHEVPQIKAAIAAIWARCPTPPPQPTLTVIVVGKRHHVRFFPANDQESDQRSGNCRGGLVVDQHVNNAHGAFFDFYLQSQGGLKGTSKPSHYVVVYNDDNTMNADVLQGISYALCHVHARATRSIGIPAPVYYADLVCSRVDYHLKGANYDNESIHSGGSEFDLQSWVDKFRAPKYFGKMYFI